MEHLQVFNVILSPGEMDQAAQRPGSITRGRVVYFPLATVGDYTDRVQGMRVTNAVAITQGDHAPVVPWSPSRAVPRFVFLNKPLLKAS